MKMKKAIFASAMLLTATLANAGNVLVVMSDVDTLDLKDGKTFSTGFYLNELMEPVKMLLEAGHQVTFATPQGKAPTLDKGSVNAMHFGGDAAALETHLQLLEQLKITAPGHSPVISLGRVEQIGYDRFDAVYVPGGHAPMQDLLISPALGRLLQAFHAKGKTTALVCHGPIALVAALPEVKQYVERLERNPQTKAANWIYRGYRMTSFSNTEEAAVSEMFKGGEMKFNPETALTQAGGNFSRASQLWQGHMEEDRELITGQNPASAKLIGQRLLQRLAAAAN